jgi:hypothetical protein
VKATESLTDAPPSERKTITMKNLTLPCIVAGLATAFAIGVAPTAAAIDSDSTSPAPAPAVAAPQPSQVAVPIPAPAPRGTVALPPGGEISTFPQDQTIGGADPLVPFGTDPYVPYGVWAP